MSATPPAAGRAGYWLAVAAFVGLGVFLRLQQITLQWLTDDEWHAVHKLLQGTDYRSILLSFGYSDYCIPLTVLYKFLAESVGLSELRMRLPMLAAGLAFLVAAPVWARSRLGARGAVAFGFLLALSPLLVNYSRYARPYMITLLLASLAVCALAAWLRSGRRKYLYAYLAASLTAGYFHLIVVPFLLAPLLLALLPPLARAERLAVSGRAVVGTGLALGAGLALLVLPPLYHDWLSIGSKSEGALPGLETIWGALFVWFGTASMPVVVLFTGLALLGLPTALRRFRLELLSWLVGLVGIAALILVFRPAWVDTPLVFARYLLPALPLLLILAAAGIDRVAGSLSWRPAGHLAALVLVAASAVGSPMPALLERPNNFTLHAYHQFDYRPGHNLARRAFLDHVAPAPFWSRFAAEPPGRLGIAVAGQPSFETFFVPFVLEQPVHRQRLFHLQTGGACAEARPGEAFPEQGVFLRNAVSLRDRDDLARKGVDWVVFEYVRGIPNVPVDPAAHEAYLERCRSYLMQALGPAAYEDERLIAFRLGPP